MTDVTLVMVPVTIGLVQMVKAADPEEKLARFYPLLAEVIGVALGLFMKVDLLASLTIGLMAMGLYSGGAKMIKG